jgi:hypothetical protein
MPYRKFNGLSMKCVNEYSVLLLALPPIFECVDLYWENLKQKDCGKNPHTFEALGTKNQNIH